MKDGQRKGEGGGSEGGGSRNEREDRLNWGGGRGVEG